jgi:uncharacterized RDD family membrane protein YckC
MQTISVRTTQNVAIQYPIGSVGDRILAFLIDRIILIAYAIVVIAAFINLDVEIVWLWIVLLVIPFFCFNLFFEIFMNGQSPGKRVMNIQVVRLDGTQPTFGDYLLRFLFGLIDFYVLSGALAVVIIAINGRGQRLGDIVAGTCVVKLIAQKEITANEVFVTPENSYSPTFPQVTQLDSRDIELVQRALEARSNFGNEQPVLMVTEKLRSLLGIQTELAPAEFLYTIVKDYNYLNAR